MMNAGDPGARRAAAATVDQARIDAARLKIERVIGRFPILELFPTDRRLLEEARDLLDPKCSGKIKRGESSSSRITRSGPFSGR